MTELVARIQADDSPGPSARSPLQALRDRANTVLPGLYAWVTTIALPSVQRTAPPLARVTAFCALFALIAAPLFVTERPRLGRALGVYAFIGLALLTWLLLGAGLLQNRGDPLLSALGALGFMLYALGWGSAAIAGARGVMRAGGQPKFLHLFGMAFYWLLQSLAAVKALHQFVTAPHHWDKTRHAPRSGRPGP